MPTGGRLLADHLRHLSQPSPCITSCCWPVAAYVYSSPTHSLVSATFINSLLLHSQSIVEGLHRQITNTSFTLLSLD